MKEPNGSFGKEAQWEITCDACRGTRFVGVDQVGDGYEFIECEKCHGTGRLSVIQYGFSKDDEE